MSRTSFTRYAVTIPDIVTAIGKLRWKRLPSFSDRQKAVFAPINIVGRRDTINEMINMNTHDYNARGYAARYRDESAMVKVRRMNVHLKGQGKMQVSNGGVDKKNLYKRNGQSCQLQSSRFKIPRTMSSYKYLTTQQNLLEMTFAMRNFDERCLDFHRVILRWFLSRQIFDAVLSSIMLTVQTR